MILNIAVIIVLILLLIGYGFIFYRTSDSKKASRIIIPFVILSLFGYAFTVVQTKNQVVYREVESVKIFINQADQDYYFKHNGQVIPLKEACEDQYPSKIPPNRVSSIPNVTVYERSYMPWVGIKYSGIKDFVYVHGYDARIDQSIELE